MFTIETQPSDLSATYAALDVKGKAALRAAHKAAVTEAIQSGDLPLAQHLIGLEAALKAAPKVTTGPDYVEAVRNLRANLIGALAAIRSGDIILPEGVTVDLSEVDLTGGTVDPKAVRQLVTVSGRKAGRGDVVAWIDSVLSDQPMTIAELQAAHEPTDDYPTAPPSAGAIGAALKRVESGETEAPFKTVYVGEAQKRGAGR